MQYFRRVMYQAEGLSRKQMGPLVASSQFKRHPALKPGDRSVEWFVVFWFWVPPGKRDRRNLSTFPSRMTSAKPFELQALGEGEIEEITFNQKFPLDMPKSARDAYLLELWKQMCLKRLGFIPDATGYGSTAAPAVTVSARAAAHEQAVQSSGR